ncbi:hypothetical protein GS528_16835 [Rhodococcus hoagii]|nr:hypothetical protein [Prescottella equi]
MTDVIDDMFTVAGRRDNGTATIRSAVLRPSNERPGAVTPADHKFDIVNGQLRLLNLDPGPAQLFIRMGTWVMQWTNVSIPDSATPITLRTVLDNYVEYEPGVVSEVRGHADRAEASAIRSESAADQAEESEQYVQGVVDNGVAMVRAEVQDNADAAIAASSAAASSALAAAGSGRRPSRRRALLAGTVTRPTRLRQRQASSATTLRPPRRSLASTRTPQRKRPRMRTMMPRPPRRRGRAQSQLPAPRRRMQLDR